MEAELLALLAALVASAMLVWVKYNLQRVLRAGRISAQRVSEANQMHRLQAQVAQLQAQLEDAQRANAAKSDFLSKMSHELRTPLNGILGFVQLILEDNEPPLSAEHRESLTVVQRSGKHLLHLVNELLDLAKIETANVDVVLSPVMVGAVLAECQEFVHPLLRDKKLRFYLKSSLPDDVEVSSNALRLKQILINLLANAIKYNREGGKVTVSISACPDDSQHIRVSVQDTGFGISQDKQTRLFQAFDRAGQENSSVEGTGLGLLLVRYLADRLQAQLGFASESGKGSCFWIDLPCVQETVSASTPVTSTESPVGLGDLGENPVVHTKQILYIEDDHSNIQLVESILRRYEKHNLIAARDGESGLRIARLGFFDMILLDINLPDTSGFDLIQSLRNDPATSHIPVVALTADASQKSRHAAHQLGFAEHLTKPLDVYDFLKSTRRVLADHQA